MRKKVGKFLKDNFVAIIVYTSLVCVGIWDSTIALVIYSTVIHICVLLLVICLYYPELIENKGNSGVLRKVSYRIAETIGIMAILVMTGHWYTLCVSVFCIFLSLVHLYDINTERIREDEIQNIINKKG